jgi:2-keto-3-deoxy-L-rhamnonate aldolase RhmA
MAPSPSLIPVNYCKKLLKEGKPVIGTFVVEFRQPVVMQLLANAGFDFVLIDNEHGPFSIESIAELSRAAVHLGLTPIVRIPDITYPHIAQTMDVGAQGLMVPRITDASQVRTIIQMLHYPPGGERGNAMSRGLTQFRSGDVSTALIDIERETLLVIQVETLPAVSSIREILAVPGVDVALIGPNDLSIALGVPGETAHPKVQEAIRQTIEACQAAGVAPAIHMPNLDQAAYWAMQGMRMISTGSEAAFIYSAGQNAVKTLRNVFTS